MESGEKESAQSKKLTQEELDELGATFVKFLSHEMEHNTSNWNEFYEVLQEACKSKENESCYSNDLKANLAGSKKKQEGHSDNVPVNGKEFKINTEGTRRQYKQSDHAQKSTSFRESSKTNNSPFANMDAKQAFSKQNSSGSNFEKERTNRSFQTDEMSKRKNNQQKRSKDVPGRQKSDRKRKKEEKAQKNSIPEEYKNCNRDNKIPDNDEYSKHVSDTIRNVLLRCLTVAKETVFFVGCLLVLVLFVAFKILWNVLKFFARLFLYIGVWTLIKILEFAVLINSRYGIFQRISKFFSVSIELVQLITGINFRRFSRANLSKLEEEEDNGVVPPLPMTAAEAVHHLLQQNEEKPYRTLCLSHQAADSDIKVNYRKLALLVHPDKCTDERADEAFKVLDCAFKKIADPQKRAELSEQMERERQWKEFNKQHADEFQQMFDEFVNTIPCSSCHSKHKRTLMKDRNFTEARYCGDCNKKHPAADGDIWAETNIFGYNWTCYVCLDGEIYELTEWATCQNLRQTIPANSHKVPCKLGTRGESRQRRRRREAQHSEPATGGKKQKGKRSRKTR